MSDWEVETIEAYGSCHRCRKPFVNADEWWAVERAVRYPWLGMFIRTDHLLDLYHRRCVPPNQLAGSRPARPLLLPCPNADDRDSATHSAVTAG